MNNFVKKSRETINLCYKKLQSSEKKALYSKFLLQKVATWQKIKTFSNCKFVLQKSHDLVTKIQEHGNFCYKK